MKGVSIPFIDFTQLDSNSHFGVNGKEEFFSNPVYDNYYDIIPVIKEDFMVDGTKPYILPIYGEFKDGIDTINSVDNTNISNILDYQWLDTTTSIEYPSVIEGYHMGYGGFIEERYNEDTINTIMNKDSSSTIKKITSVDNKQYIFLQFNRIYNDTFDNSNLTENYNLINQSNRNTYLDYEINLNLLDEIFKAKTLSDYQENISIFGTDGKILTKKIKTPYDLNPDNYIYMSIPNLTHIKSIQTSAINDNFAKIILPGDSNKILYNSFVAGTKIFYNNLFNNLNELEVTFITNDGFLFDFNGSEHSFTLEITEIIDKFEYINPRFET